MTPPPILNAITSPVPTPVSQLVTLSDSHITAEHFCAFLHFCADVNFSTFSLVLAGQVAVWEVFLEMGFGRGVLVLVSIGI